MTDFNTFYTTVLAAKHPEDIFGIKLTEDELTQKFHDISMTVHPDKWSTDPIVLPKATECFRILMDFRNKAKSKLAVGKYGKLNVIDNVVITTKKNTYTLTDLIAEGDLCQVYVGTDDDGVTSAFKIVNSPRNTDLMVNENNVLNSLWDDVDIKDMPVMKHIMPKPLATFEFTQSGIEKKVTVFPYLKSFVTLQEVIKAYPDGLDVRDAAWMINRLLGALMVPFKAGIVHGAIVPNNFLIECSTHNGMLIDWCFSVKNETPLKAISSKYKDFYPTEVFSKKPVNSSLDIYMTAKLFLKLIGGNIATNQFPTGTPKEIQSLFKACFLGPKHRISDPFELHNDFSEVLKGLYGARKFRPFSLNNVG